VPFLGDFWTPVLDRVREVELGHPAPWVKQTDDLCTSLHSCRCGFAFGFRNSENNLMSRPAEEILEFDSCAKLLRAGARRVRPGRGALDALKFSQDRERLERGFALIREAREWVRAGKELGFGALSDPEGLAHETRRAGNRIGSGRIFWTQRLF